MWSLASEGTGASKPIPSKHCFRPVIEKPTINAQSSGRYSERIASWRRHRVQNTCPTFE